MNWNLCATEEKIQIRPVVKSTKSEAYLKPPQRGVSAREIIQGLDAREIYLIPHRYRLTTSFKDSTVSWKQVIF